MEIIDPIFGFETHCGHKFHIECINKWTSTNNTCPMCRAENVCIRYTPNSDNCNRSYHNNRDIISTANYDDNLELFNNILDRSGGERARVRARVRAAVAAMVEVRVGAATAAATAAVAVAIFRSHVAVCG